LTKNEKIYHTKFVLPILRNMGLGSGIPDPEKPIPNPDPEAQKSTRSRIQIRNTASYYESFTIIQFSKDKIAV
jgi:hypothetical protein